MSVPKLNVGELDISGALLAQQFPQRPRGMAWVIALSALPYSIHTNPAFAEIAHSTAQAVRMMKTCSSN
ncbi:hypothetical protein ACFFLM_13855 [Deinococcus oregonensis]|uniref:Uncharacterized protein n=1 Tax=Deinococcus oregonensis TaxID=1805970 RepID=A0ABV6AZX4_9DEIO